MSRCNFDGWSDVIGEVQKRTAVHSRFKLIFKYISGYTVKSEMTV